MSPPISRKFNFGTLAPPTASAPGGVYAAPETVALSSAPGTTIRYTLDGSEPTAVSNLYVTPIPVTVGTVVVKARAFHADWTMSPVVTETYTIDTVAPTITARVFPSPLNGWHSSPVTVTFTCTDAVGVASCSLPATVATEGAGQVLTGTAVDLAGRQATLDVTLNLDFVAPEVTLIGPADGLVTSDTAVLLTGQVSDALSGISTATCNGVAATVVDGHVSCAVPLRPGRNAVVLHARDLAGHAASVGVTVARVGTATRLTLAPATRTLLVDEVAELSLLDDFGVPVPEAAWTSSDAGIVSLSPDDPPVLTAVSAGAATVTATKNGLTSEATITVVAGTVLVDGTTRWALAPTPGLTLEIPLYAHRVDAAVPDVFTFEADASGHRTVQAVTASGQVPWVAGVSGTPLMGDSFGGFVTGDFAGFDVYGLQYSGLARYAAAPGTAPWRYESPGLLGRPAQAADGTIFVVERVDTARLNYWGAPIQETFFVVIDGSTGAVRTRTPLAAEVSNRGTCSTQVVELPPVTVGPIVGLDGHGYLAVRQWREQPSGACPQGTYTVSQDAGLTLLRVSPAGTVAPTVLLAQHCDLGVSSSWQSVCDEPPVPQALLPDGLGGTLVMARYTTGVTYSLGDPQYPSERRVTRFDGAGGRTDTPVADDLIQMVDDTGTAYVFRDGVLHAVDVTTWATRWTSTAGDPIAALIDGRVALQDVNTGAMSEVANGEVFQTSPLGLSAPVQMRFGLWSGVDALAPTPVVAMRVSLALNPAVTSFGGIGAGNAQGQSAPPPDYPTVHLAAVERLQFYNPRSIKINREFGGSICRNSQGRFTATWSTGELPAGSDYVYSTGCEVIPVIPMMQLEGRYHTHGVDGNIGLSWGDATRAQLESDVPWFVASRCGGIYEYSAFTTPRPWEPVRTFVCGA